MCLLTEVPVSLLLALDGGRRKGMPLRRALLILG